MGTYADIWHARGMVVASKQRFVERCCDSLAPRYDCSKACVKAWIGLALVQPVLGVGSQGGCKQFWRAPSVRYLYFLLIRVSTARKFVLNF
eukprot:6211189-Pleurochrysis_carterae.AAC.1